jgi:RNA polymerase sigma factor (TIGR02999 family)
MKGPLAENVTEILQALNAGDSTAYEKLIPVIYSELHKIAKHHIGLERSNHTLQPTALIHEAYLRLVKDMHPSWQNRKHFFGAAAEVMRRVLVDYARKRNADKRGFELMVTVKEDVLQSIPDPRTDSANSGSNIDILDLNEALVKLENLNPRMAQIVELRFFCDLSFKEIAEMMNIAERTVMRQWPLAKSWLYREMSSELPK